MAKLEISVNLNETRYNGSNQIFKILCFEHLCFLYKQLFSQISIFSKYNSVSLCSYISIVISIFVIGLLS